MRYWYYTYIKPEYVIGHGVLRSSGYNFPFVDFFRQYPNSVVLNMTKIDKMQYEALREMIEEKHKKEGIENDKRYEK